ncbi:MAG: hypothetical protein WC164_01795 [Patescibacteria group bacterium]
MFDYLNKFNNLSDDIKGAVDSDEAVRLIEEIEKKYKVDLASIIMRVATKDINIDNLPLIFFTELNLGQSQAESLAKELEEKIFYKIADYLGLEKKKIETEPKKESKTEVKAGVEKEKTKVVNISSGINNNEQSKNDILIEDLKLLGEEFDDLNEDLSDQDFIGGYLKSDYLNKIKNQVDKIFDILNLNFSEENRNKFISYLEKYFKGIKSKIEIRQFFVKPIEMGGLGLADKMIDNIFMIADSLKDEEYQEVKSKTKVDQGVLDKIGKLGMGKSLFNNYSQMLEAPDSSHLLPVSDSSHLLSEPNNSGENKVINEKKEGLSSLELSKIVKKQRELLEKIESKNNKKSEDNISNKEFLSKQDSDFSKFEEEILSEINKQIENEIKMLDEKNKNLSKAEVKEAPTASNNSSFNASNKANEVLSGNKIKMTDVKKVKIMSPVDEIRYLDLTNFRRFSKDPKEALEKIREKIKVLEGLDYTKMIEGIKAWRQSPVHKLYLKIFLDAGNRGLSLDQVISELRSYGKDFLSKEEIDAIIEFNKTLRF